MHRIALERLQRAQQARHQYIQHRVDEALTTRFDAWDAEERTTSDPGDAVSDGANGRPSGAA